MAVTKAGSAVLMLWAVLCSTKGCLFACTQIELTTSAQHEFRQQCCRRCCTLRTQLLSQVLRLAGASAADAWIVLIEVTHHQPLPPPSPQGLAYEQNGSVYFRVAQHRGYGALANIKFEGMQVRRLHEHAAYTLLLQHFQLARPRLLATCE